MSLRVSMSEEEVQERTLVAQLTSPDVHYVGVLKKKGEAKLSGWTSRHFELIGSKLSYYEDGTLTKKKGVIDITSAKILESTENKYAFSIEGPFTMRKFELQSETNEGRQGWMRTLVKSMEEAYRKSMAQQRLTQLLTERRLELERLRKLVNELNSQLTEGQIALAQETAQLKRLEEEMRNQMAAFREREEVMSGDILEMKAKLSSLEDVQLDNENLNARIEELNSILDNAKKEIEDLHQAEQVKDGEMQLLKMENEELRRSLEAERSKDKEGAMLQDTLQKQVNELQEQLRQIKQQGIQRDGSLADFKRTYKEIESERDELLDKNRELEEENQKLKEDLAQTKLQLHQSDFRNIKLEEEIRKLQGQCNAEGEAETVVVLRHQLDFSNQQREIYEKLLKEEQYKRACLAMELAEARNKVHKLHVPKK